MIIYQNRKTGSEKPQISICLNLITS